MFKVRLQTNISALNSLAEARPNEWRNTKQALRLALELTRQTWFAAATGAVTVDGSRRIRNVAYGNSLVATDAIQIPDGTELSGAVVSTYKYAGDIEHGYGPFDQKSGLLAGPKSRTRTGKSGQRYNVVPFGWLTPKNPGNSGGFTTRMDEGLYKAAKRLEYGQGLTAQSLRDVDARNNTGWAIPRVSHTGYEHAVPLAQNLMKQGAPRHTKYRTFRTVSDKSNPLSWIHPGLPPNPIIEGTMQSVRTKVQEMIEAGIRADLLAVFG